MKLLRAVGNECAVGAGVVVALAFLLVSVLLIVGTVFREEFFKKKLYEEQ